jgi:hypothetical protein
MCRGIHRARPPAVSYVIQMLRPVPEPTSWLSLPETAPAASVSSGIDMATSGSTLT